MHCILSPYPFWHIFQPSICLHKVLVLISTVKKSLINDNKIPTDLRRDASRVPIHSGMSENIGTKIISIQVLLIKL